MPYLIQGNSQEFFTAFGYDDFVSSGTSSHSVLLDIERTCFLGTAEDCQFHIDTWKDPVKSDHAHFTQGNMSAGNLFLMFGPQPFKEEDMDEIEYNANLARIDFAFVDKNKQLCGFSLHYLKDDPGKWIIGMVKNTNLLPSQRQVRVLTSVDPQPFIKKETALFIEPVTLDDKSLLEMFNVPYLVPYLQHMLDSDGNINVHAEVIGLFLQMVRPVDRFEDNLNLLDCLNNNIQAILANKALQIMQQLSLHPSLSQILECLDTNSPLYQSVCSIPLHDEYRARQDIDLLLAEGVQEQKRCITDKLLMLKLDKSIIDLLQRDDESGRLFLKAVCEVEFACQEIRKRLLKESVKKYKDSIVLETNYRKAMYAMLCEQILTPSDKTQFCDKIRGIEEPFLKALDVDTQPWVRQTLMVLVNTLTLLFTLGILNVWHKSVTGDFLFFYRPASSEALKMLDLQLIDTIPAPAA